MDDGLIHVAGMQVKEDEARRVVGLALDLRPQPLVKCLGCGILNTSPLDNIRNIHLNAAQLKERRAFLATMVIGAEAGTLLAVCARCAAAAMAGHAALLRRL